MFEFIFRMTDNSKFVINNVAEEFVDAIWDQLDSYCAIFETETKKVKTVLSKEVK